MPRPEKCRNVCNEPKCSCFLPIHNNGEEVLLQVDEYETLRLIDYENYSQEECGRYMNIARTTVQGIYERARKKLADVLVNGKKLIIEGGEYKLCEYRGNCDFCTKGCTKNKKNGGFQNENSGKL